MKAYLFPGQGAQKRGMGKHLFDKYSTLVEKSNSILGYDIQMLCNEDPDKKLNQTEFTQPALFVVNALEYLDKTETESKPDFVAGHSLGEFNALFAAEVFDFETGLRLVQKRAALMSQAKSGGMAAVIGLKMDEIQSILNKFHFDTISIANYNSRDQIVVSGERKAILDAKKVFEANGAKLYFPLNVSGAFHSPYMSEARAEFAGFISEFQFSKIQIPIIANVTGRAYLQSQIKENLINQIDSSVNWYESISYMIAKGVDEFVEVGNSNVLTKIQKYIEKEPLPINEVERKIENEEQKSPVLSEYASLSATTLGSDEFRKTYNVKYAYVTGSMYRGIASKELVVQMARARFLSFFGTGGLSLSEIKAAVNYIQNELSNGETFGVNLLHNLYAPEKEMKVVELCLALGVHNIEASAFMGVTPAIAFYRIKGLSREYSGAVSIKNRVMVKISRPEVAEAFMSPIPNYIIDNLLKEGRITDSEAELAKAIPLADDVCAEADSAGHTDQASAFTLYPTILRLRDDIMQCFNYKNRIRVGAAGGIGVPESIAAAFLLGVDFVLTGSINQCTVQAGISDSAKDLLQNMNVQDTDYVPAGDMFELGSRVQVLKKGLFFPARANKLRELYKRYDSLDEITPKDKKYLEEKYFKKSFDTIYQEIKDRKGEASPEILKAEEKPKAKMALLFKWYFGYSTELALKGITSRKVDYQIHCGPALGAFNRWVKGSDLENWRNRNVDEIAGKLMTEAADYLETFHTNKNLNGTKTFGLREIEKTVY